MRIQAQLSINRMQLIVQTLAILVLMAGLFGLMGYLVLGVYGLFLALGLSIVLLAMSPRIAPALVLRMYGARELSQSETPGLYALVAELSKRADLVKPPKLYYIPSKVMNAFSVGNRDDSALAFSDGIVRYLNWREIAGVFGHEIGHIRNNDLWIYSLADMLTRITSALSLFGQLMIVAYLPLLIFSDMRIPLPVIILMIFAPSMAMFMQMALSRTREYAADMAAVELTGDSQGLAAALMKMEQYQSRIWDRVLFPGRNLPEPSMLRTHPHTKERLERLRILEDGRAYQHEERGKMLPDHFPLIQRPPRWHWLRSWH